MFRVGDKVIISPRAGERYSITRPGSYGTIIKVYDKTTVNIKFDYIASNIRRDGLIWQIATEYLDYLEPETILSVINRLHTRQHFYQTIGKDLPAWSLTKGSSTG